jgi:hypothetical protein
VVQGKDAAQCMEDELDILRGIVDEE